MPGKPGIKRGGGSLPCWNRAGTSGAVNEAAAGRLPICKLRVGVRQTMIEAMKTHISPCELWHRVRLVLVIFALNCGAALAGAESTVTDQVDAHLAAGEYSSALRIADTAPADQREGLLQRIAVAQNDNGARRAADQTLQHIRDDRVRAHALDHIVAQRFGGADPILAQIGGGVGDGGDSTADFEAIIELITTTIEPESWEETGGAGTIAEFEGGVVVDASGVLRRTALQESGQPLSDLRTRALQADAGRDVRQSSPLRKVSLPRLELAAQLRAAAGHGPDQEMQMLAGLTRIEYVLVYPETGDLVIAGPAGDWRRDPAGRVVNAESGRPVLQLDDLVVVLRQISRKSGSRFGCSITPRQQSLARVKAFVAESSKKPLKAGRTARQQWLEELREAVGTQDIEVYGVDPGTRVARILVEADYHMKRIGIGLEPGADGMTSYLHSIPVGPGQAPPPMDVLRWWFTLDYRAIETTSDRNAFHLRGQGVQVLSENEMLNQMGKRIHTGKSDELNQQFAGSFTRHFSALAAKYPVYAELQNIFDLAMVAEICRQYDLPLKVDWHMQTFADPAKFVVATGPAPREVETIINHRMAGKGQIIACVSGGVRVDPGRLVTKDRVQTKDSGEIVADYASSHPAEKNDRRWWWD